MSCLGWPAGLEGAHDLCPQWGCTGFLFLLLGKRVKNHFKGNDLLGWAIMITPREAVHKFVKKGSASYCTPLLVGQPVLPRSACAFRYYFINPVARILVSDVSFLLSLCWLWFCGFCGIKPPNCLRQFHFFSNLLNIIIFVSMCLSCEAIISKVLIPPVK